MTRNLDLNLLKTKWLLEEKTSAIRLIPEGAPDGWSGGYMSVRYGFDMQFAASTKQDPHFYAVYDGYEKTSTRKNGSNFQEAGGGSNSELIAFTFPELAQAVRWHLASWPGTPMYYHENGMYWFFEATGLSQFDNPSYRNNPLDNFKHTIVAGVCADDGYWIDRYVREYAYRWESPQVKKMMREEAKEQMSRHFGAWLQNRETAMSYAFIDDMVQLGVATPINAMEAFWEGNTRGDLTRCASCHSPIAFQCAICGKGACCSPVCLQEGEFGFCPSTVLSAE